MSKARILVIEDEEDIQELLRYHLEREFFEVRQSRDGPSGLQLARTTRPSLILLDLMLPGLSGLEVCRMLKQQEGTRSIPIIMLTARSEESDIVLGLELGADDYVTKPFSPRELLARLRAVLRRRQPQEVGRARLEVGPLVMDLERHEVRLGGEPLSLTLAQFRLLEALLSHPGRVFTRDQLLDEITPEGTHVVDRNVDVHVAALRRKLGKEASWIVTVRGVGYKCRDPVN